MLGVQISQERVDCISFFRKLILKHSALWNRCFLTNKDVTEPRVLEKGAKDASRTIKLRPGAAEPDSGDEAGRTRATGLLPSGGSLHMVRTTAVRDKTEGCQVSRQCQPALPVLPGPFYYLLRPWCLWTRCLRWAEGPYPISQTLGGKSRVQTHGLNRQRAEGRLPLPP